MKYKFQKILFIIIGMGIIGSVWVWNSNYSLNYINSESMEPTISKNSFIICHKIKDKTKLERGDIITFRYPVEKNFIYIKRVIGVPGDRIIIKEGIVTVNGEKLKEDYVVNKWTRGTGDYDYIVPADSYFVLGDNRNNSEDSRYWEEEYFQKYGVRSEKNSFVKRKDIVAVWRK